MSEEFKVTLPKLGESILTATVVQWFKKEGDFIKVDEPLLEVSTDKVNSEIPSPVSGVVKSILAQADQELDVGAALAVIALSGMAPPVVEKAEAQSKQETSHAVSSSSEMSDFYSPAILRQAKESGIGLGELEKIARTGNEGRLTKKDLEDYITKKKCPGKPCPASFPKATLDNYAQDVERVKMSGMRKAIAENMVRSFYQAPHATLVAEVDVTAIIKTVAKEKESFLAKHGAKLTITSFVARSIAKALQEYPLINSSLEQDTIVVKRYVNLGIAVSVDQGLFVPVIKNCQKMSLASIAQTIGDLSTRARSNKLSNEDVAEGTITMTNFGMSGVQIGIPIIRYPEVAIVGIGAIEKKVVVVENDQMAIRSMMHICLTFDHRVLDGMYGCGFLGALKKHLESDITLD